MSSKIDKLLNELNYSITSKHTTKKQRKAKQREYLLEEKRKRGEHIK